MERRGSWGRKLEGKHDSSQGLIVDGSRGVVASMNTPACLTKRMTMALLGASWEKSRSGEKRMESMACLGHNSSRTRLPTFSQR